MIKVTFPVQNFKIRQVKQHEEIFDRFRKIWCVLTPEEWVRQNLLNYLSVACAYPESLMSIEKEITIGELKKRCDVVIYDRSGKPWMIIECKEMNVPLGKKVMEQILLYHSKINVPYLVISNGSYTYCFEKQGDEFYETDALPLFSK